MYMCHVERNADGGTLMLLAFAPFFSAKVFAAAVALHERT